MPQSQGGEILFRFLKNFANLKYWYFYYLATRLKVSIECWILEENVCLHFQFMTISLRYWINLSVPQNGVNTLKNSKTNSLLFISHRKLQRRKQGNTWRKVVFVLAKFLQESRSMNSLTRIFWYFVGSPKKIGLRRLWTHKSGTEPMLHIVKKVLQNSNRKKYEKNPFLKISEVAKKNSVFS